MLGVQFAKPDGRAFIKKAIKNRTKRKGLLMADDDSFEKRFRGYNKRFRDAGMPKKEIGVNEFKHHLCLLERLMIIPTKEVTALEELLMQSS